MGKIDFKFYIGLFFIVTGLIISLIIYFMVIGIPIFLLGAIIMWFSRKQNNEKAKWIAIPFVVYVLVMVVISILYHSFYGNSKIIRKDFLISEDYRGLVCIVLRTVMWRRSRRNI